tara:strand:- start:165 stop:470 length:306 start_codon:yes stop_codon:yes gene_type:complete
MNFNKSKSTKRFSFEVSRNTSSHKAGANTLTISTKNYSNSGRGYVAGTSDPTSLTMTVKEAKALRNFLNRSLDGGSGSGTDTGGDTGTGTGTGTGTKGYMS